MKNRIGKKNIIANDTVKKPSVEYTTEELIELGKKLNVLNLAPPLYSNKDDSDKIDGKNTK